VDYTERTALLGGVVGNFQALEFLLRLFLGGENEMFRLPLKRAKEGDTLPECQFTDWSSLGQLIGKANVRFLRLGLPQRLDTSLSNVRDALAHGRVFSPENEPDALLFKFSHPKRGRVTVEARYTLDDKTLTDFRGRTSDAIEMVAAGAGGRPWQPDLSER